MSNDFELPTKSTGKAITKPMATKKADSAPAVADVKPETTERVESSEVQSGEKKYDPIELLTIFDEIIFSGEYVEEVTIRGRLSVKFSTRTAEQVDELQSALDGAKLTLISSVEQKRAILGLEQALVEFNGTKLSGLPKDARSKFISKLAAPVILMLLTALSEFDMKVAAACREEVNF